jgi:hypothetical protein
VAACSIPGAVRSIARGEYPNPQTDPLIAMSAGELPVDPGHRRARQRSLLARGSRPCFDPQWPKLNFAVAA